MTSGTSIDLSPPSELGDDDLQVYARFWRNRALRGEKHANGRAHELEVEMRRRFGPGHTSRAEQANGDVTGQVAHITLVRMPGGVL